MGCGCDRELRDCSVYFSGYLDSKFVILFVWRVRVFMIFIDRFFLFWGGLFCRRYLYS